jgi:rod shape-determining protein MreC
VAIFISLFILFGANKSEDTGGIHALAIQAAGRITAPVSTFKQLLRVYEENRRLRYQNSMLQLKNARLAEAFEENKRLRKLVDFAPPKRYDSKAAKVIGSGGVASIKTILIDGGRDQGVRRDMPVVSTEGLVGRIIEVSSGFAVTQLLVDRNFRAAARIQRSREVGIFKWTKGEFGELAGIHQRADVVPGDALITTGQNSLFPPGLKIGEVTSVRKNPGGLFLQIGIKPAVDFTKLAEVFVINYRPVK